MPLLQLQQVTLQYGSAPLLDQVSFQIEPGERVCLLGRNGAGKTSLMRVITGEEQPDGGEVVRPPGTTMTRLDQEIPDNISGLVVDVIHHGMRRMASEEDWEADVRVDELLEAMGLPRDVEFSTLSGGLKRRVLLARALAGLPDLLLLDEPTNHLDLSSILWLEEYLIGSPMTLFFVTHDRTFLKKLATRIVEIDRGALTSWACDYTTYLERKAANIAAEEKQWASFDKKLAQEEVWLRQGVKARRTRNEGRVRALEAMRGERAKRREREGTARLEVQEGSLSGQKVIEVKDITFGYGDGEPVIRDFSTTIWRGDKIGIIGPNGGGKSTLLGLLLGRLTPDSGSVKLGTNLQVVYLDQLRDRIDGEKTVAWNVAGEAESVTFQGKPRHIHSYLLDFLFRSDRIRMPARLLSGGERNRLLLAKLFLQPANVLVLDEPTNDLDAETLELLEELLVSYQGTLLLVSHDRAFLDNVVTDTMVFEEPGVIREYVGGYEDWLRQRREPSKTLPVAVEPPPRPQQTKTSSKPGAKFSNKEARELEELPALLEKLEARQEAVATQLQSAEIYKDRPEAATQLTAETAELAKQISTGYARWEELESKRLQALS